MNRNRFPSFFYPLTFLLLSLTALMAQEKTPQELFVEDKLECYSLATEIDGQEYQKSLKCISKDSICYIIQGFAMSCIPRTGRYPAELPNLTPKPTQP
ncbi:hypothetical protein [Leptospira kanakyensis]|uniref:DUF1496 domain-containing protein n=1 Tax=Leptospira kanakyensis TaxID=2484968 RepID=A0A6N4Q9W9_9LEPT|nr:hypothetical protein [Leptospira kanakyensis]MCW7468962.1 hypothetical protein [Leptospira kanakyensis]MCW7479949.1 hypothetical protein [Leptospira kanakyensis]TGK50176.1 hypothetical protein EHQ11_10690 [Leptospira kanakyensis]TGK64223.1 hypothetical protein EHQ16_07325 [Leptospira kanakyensis]TGK69314.1 hypothetical protein EHQ18_10850 [Leptospira kanakyensis]